MSGLEVVGVALAIPAVVQQLINISVKGYDIFQSAKLAGTELQKHQVALKVIYVKLEEWVSQLQRLGEDLEVVLGASTMRYATTLDVLALIAGEFVGVNQLNKKYQVAGSSSDKLPRVEGAQLEVKRPERWRTRLSWLRRSRKKIGHQKTGAVTSDDNFIVPSQNIQSLKEASRSTSELSEYSDAPAVGSIGTLLDLSSGINLDTCVTGLDLHIKLVEEKTSRYGEALKIAQCFDWALYDSQKLEKHISQLDLFTSWLYELTRRKFKVRLRGLDPTLTSRPFNEFEPPFVPSHPLDTKFCGRDDEMNQIKSYLETGSQQDYYPRVMVNLHGMGGIGKSQLARQFVETNKKSYTAIIWIHAADTRTLHATAIQFLKALVAHYDTKYNSHVRTDQRKFEDVEKELGIPGQIDGSGQLTNEASKNPWHFVRNWMLKEGNHRWCLVFDSIDTKEGIEGINKLLPSCHYGHVIITSRIRVPDAEIISIPHLDLNSSVKLLLGRKTDVATEVRQAAEEVANKLGYLPVALSQAAAYVARTALSLVKYLARLNENLSRYLGMKSEGYPEGVFSCWMLSVHTIMESNPYAIELLRLCSFLSPHGVSEELLYRGVGAIDWAQNDTSRLDEALDELVTYSLITRKSDSFGTSEEKQSFWIHPLVQHWAKNYYCKENIVVLEDNKERLAELHSIGARAAIRLVGWGVVGQPTDRKLSECVYERANMAHLNLCMDQYLLKQKVVNRDSKDKKLAAALFRLGETKCEWEEDHIAIEVLKTSIQIYTNALPEDPNVEVDLLIARQRLLGVYMHLGVDSFDSEIDVEYIGREINEIRQRFKVLQPDLDDFYLIRCEILQAGYFSESGELDQAAEVFESLIARLRNMEGPDWVQNMYLSSLRNRAYLYFRRGELHKAEEYLGKSVELWQETPKEWDLRAILMFEDFGLLKNELNDYAEACECFRKAAAGSELNYGLSNTLTLRLLGNLRKTYIELGQFREAVQIVEKIHRGKIL
ncbi:hypothetical protein AOL_s00215g655 [Orbilia oligospora ATCC 24927]|uniref:NB-ARC domain-containing protein n=1 Tax=Arthrobotrys oligospora (strain ATCC 24927 / CBS 115.81 / DSM 1491) TaxID=756982 RepID=G1XUJ7_ARTOA|nr:hypothetical protein AOL_s00215g655 [Orbilia oligospora ATCC 24927]EGX43199.1 hypothetical protein AOL_s00215g655 [Orbilia oligospora ATCC 24927]